MGGADLKELRRVSLVEQTATAIKDAILNDTLKPGERLVEAKLAESLHIAQPTVREALINLEHEGSVVRVPNRGTFVISFTEKQVNDIYCLRECLEALAMRLARSNLTDEGLRRVQTCLKAMRAAAENSDAVAFFDADLAFHRALWQMSGNNSLANALETVTSPFLAYTGGVRGSAYRKRADYLAVVDQHQQMADCLTKGTDQEADGVIHRAYASFMADNRRLSPPPRKEEHVQASAEKERHSGAESSLM